MDRIWNSTGFHVTDSVEEGFVGMGESIGKATFGTH